MYKNAEGYRDETAWRAIIAVAREKRIKRRKLQEDKNMERENRTGEVWRTRTVTGTEKIVLVVADHGAMAYVIHLAEEGYAYRYRSKLRGAAVRVQRSNVLCAI